jgi:hypothetical protein
MKSEHVKIDQNTQTLEIFARWAAHPRTPWRLMQALAGELQEVSEIVGSCLPQVYILDAFGREDRGVKPHHLFARAREDFAVLSLDEQPPYHLSFNSALEARAWEDQRQKALRYAPKAWARALESLGLGADDKSFLKAVRLKIQVEDGNFDLPGICFAPPLAIPGFTILWMKPGVKDPICVKVG